METRRNVRGQPLTFLWFRNTIPDEKIEYGAE